MYRAVARVPDVTQPIALKYKAKVINISVQVQLSDYEHQKQLLLTSRVLKCVYSPCSWIRKHLDEFQ